MCNLDAPHFKTDAAAREYLENTLWPHGPVCPHCGTIDSAYAVNGRPGLYRCAEAECRKDFTVTVGTVFERSKIALHKWLLAAYLICSSKKGMSSHQLHRTIGVTYKTAWFMTHRLREAMRQGGLAVPFGSGGGSVEVDETFIGRAPGKAVKRGYDHKNKVLSLVDRTSGHSYSLVVDNLEWETLRPIMVDNISHEARVLTDEASHYNVTRVYFAGHETVNHSAEEYVRLSDRSVHTNTVEGFFSVFKRGMRGVYQHCGSQHLHRYLAEFDFRYNHRVKLGYNDTMRTDAMLKGIRGKRLTYRRIGA